MCFKCNSLVKTKQTWSILEAYLKYASSILEACFKYTLEAYLWYIWSIFIVYFFLVRDNPIKTSFFAVATAPGPFLTSLRTQVMLVLILTNVQYLQNVASSFKKDSNGQNHSLWNYHHSIKKLFLPPAKFSILQGWN